MRILPHQTHLARYDSPRLNKSVWRGREIIANRAVQRLEMVTRHSAVHVMLNVKIHVPVPKPNHGVQMECSARLAKVIDRFPVGRRTVFQAYMLR